ncbi:MAG: hypothetical protein IT347_10475 [Candidatus Eisenbacteria bacterium]|nr:hypothetical protein [Candidatus Eisenbacteria bacterium]
MRTRTRLTSLTLLAAGALLATAPLRAEETPRLRVRGLLDLVLHNDTHAAEIARFDDESSPLESQRVRLFVEGSASPNIDVFTQVIFSQDDFALDGAYALVTPWPQRDLHLMAGKIPAPIGVWAPRTYSNRNPLITAPLMYQHHGSLRWDEVPLSPAALLAAAGTGWEGADYGGGPGAPGMPVVDDYGWDFGLVALGSVAPFEFSLGMTNSAPGWGSPGEDVNHGKAVQGRLGFVPTAGFRFGLSGAQGSYLGKWVRYSLPTNRTEADYLQTLGMADFAFERGRVELRAEAFSNAFETAYCGTLRSTGGYAEARYGFDSGVWLAARAGLMRHSDLTAGAVTRPWDDDVDRLDCGLGYRLSRKAALKASWQRTRLDQADGQQSFDLFLSQLSLEF